MSFKDGGYWPWLLGGLLGGGVLMNLAMVMTAADDPSFAIEEDYYQKAVNWDEHRKALRESKALGWKLEVSPTLEGAELLLRADLEDALGRDVTDATLRVEAVHLARASEKLIAVMDRDTRGFYTRLPARQAGAYEFRFEATRGEDTFLHTARADVSATRAQ